MNQPETIPPTGQRSSPMGPTGIVLLNLGGPKKLDEVGPFLLELFQDREIIQLPFQKWLGPFIAKRRTPKVQKLYEDIGGGSPILDWTNVQGKGMVERLDRLSPETAPHNFYVAFRYVHPFSEDALTRMKADGVKRAVAFTQYQHFSCATTGSSLNELWRAAGRLGMANEFQWSVIDRWPTHPGFVRAMAKSVHDGLEQFPKEERDDVLLMFSAHSLPLSIIDRGDPYPQEVGASVHEVLKAGGFKNQFVLCYQSEVGPVRWLGPSTEQVIRKLGAKGRKRVLVVGIAFTSDHIETLSEIDIEYAHLAKSVGITEFRRAPAFNGEPLFQDALAEIVLDHLESREACSSQYGLRCPGCTNPQCRDILNPANSYVRTPLTAG
ncbi:MAG: ferrochelatase [Longimicrobiales bacterium]|nr:ferrochelatase [Longimicrobiales bacterium]